MLIEMFNFLVAVFGVLMSLGHFPQARRIIKNKSAKDVSLTTYAIFATGSYVWLGYGLLINQFPIILSFVIGVAGSNLVLFLKVYYDKKKP
ncbi:MAG TPA: SemiSWEET family transporter [archaeon]|nr:SemiSWEET family transporter [archaeon]